MATTEVQQAVPPPQPPPPIFSGVYFAIIPSDDIDDEKESRLIHLLTTNGATHLNYTQDLYPLTHLISSHTDFEAYHDAIDGYIHVVKSEWVEHSLQRKKMASSRQYSPDPQFFLSDVVVAMADDISEGDKDAIMGGIAAMGGQFSNSMTKLVTHLVAFSLDNARCKLVLEKRLKCKIVIPQWFDHCFSLGKRLDDEPYVLPNPTALATPKGPPKQKYQEDLEGASQLEPKDELPILEPCSWSPSKEGRGSMIFKNKRIHFHDDLQLSNYVSNALSSLVVRAGGIVVKQFSDATVLICQFRGSFEFTTACRAGLEVGNLNWLYYLIQRKRWSAPAKRLLHYPYPEQGIEEFRGLTISVSNYSGDARTYLENLVRAAGANFSKTLAQKNTHLITAHLHGEKATAALEWNITRVNHLWLEESYARETAASVESRRYTTFPEQVNLGEVVGQVEIDRKAMEQKYYPSLSKVSQSNDVEMQDDGMAVEDSDFADTDSDDVLAININGTPSTTTPAAKSSRQRSSHKTPAQRLGVSPDFELSEPRRAKDRALNKLHSMAEDIALYQKEAKRVGGVVYGGRRVTDTDRIMLDSKFSARKRQSSEDSEDELISMSPGPSKKQKKHASKVREIDTEPMLTILATGFQDLEAVKSNLKNLNLRFVDSPLSKFDILVSPMIQRTRKFLCGLAKAPTICKADWLYEMGKLGRRLPPEDYILLRTESDQVKHQSENVDLAECLARAVENKKNGGLFKGWTIFCSPSVKGGFDAFKDIVTANGGSMLLFRGRETNVKPWQDNHDDGEDKVLYMVTAAADQKLWPKFELMAKEQGYRPQPCHSDWLCEAALTQTIPAVWKERWNVK